MSERQWLPRPTFDWPALSQDEHQDAMPADDEFDRALLLHDWLRGVDELFGRAKLGRA